MYMIDKETSPLDGKYNLRRWEEEEQRSSIEL